MEKKLLQDVSKNERLQYLKDSCYRVEQFTYPRQLSLEELELEKHDFTQNAIKVAIADQKLKIARDEFKALAKPLKLEMKHQMDKIRSSIEEITGDVFLMDDQDNNLMGYYNSEGELVYQRGLMQAEKQLRILKPVNSGTNN